MSIDNVIELFAKTKPRQAGEKTPQPLAKTKPRPVTLMAAEAVAGALEAAEGALKLYKAKAVARDAQGITRMGEKRWQAVLQAGIEAGLFKTSDQMVLYPETEDFAGESDTNMFGRPSGPDEELSELSDAPEGSLPPVVHQCGHHNFLDPGPDSQKNLDAIDAGFCCHAAQIHAAKSQRGYDLPVDWQVRGVTKPIPDFYRRSRERQEGQGWPGLCAHPTTHLYIGGVGNDCRYHNKGKERCVVHAVKE
jgi:hypothetical protein